MRKVGFDSELYAKYQSAEILKRIDFFGGKLYLEFGGKLFDDMHACRVLPGFEFDAKISMLKKLADKTEIIFVISANDIERNKIRADFGITYGMDTLRQIDKIRSMGMLVSAILVTRFNNQPNAQAFINKLRQRGEAVYTHGDTKGYDNKDVDMIVSDEGFGQNSYIKTTRPLVVVTAPGPGSGKLATCLNQLYHEYKNGIKAGYAKFETFPVWNLPLNHPVNVAYEAATADLGDVNMLDPYFYEAYNEPAVNYNRDIGAFPIVKAILSRITKEDGLYQSPTDMGVNCVKRAIIDDMTVQEAARMEILRRYYKALCEFKQGTGSASAVAEIKFRMNAQKITAEMRPVISAAIEKSQIANAPAFAISLPDGYIAAGKATDLMTSCSSAVLNAVKHLAGIADGELLLARNVLEPITALKKNVLGNEKAILNLADVLTALSICAAEKNRHLNAEKAYSKLPLLKDCESHSSCMLSDIDMSMLRKLGLIVTCEAEYATKDLYGY